MKTKVILAIIGIIIYIAFMTIFVMVTIKLYNLKKEYKQLQEEYKIVRSDYDSRLAGCYYKLKRLGE